uniref:LIM zinc-binding domain-containing protein n=1 Tax=Trichuris muris TaxID=70415 RepID=A0A5S6QQG4_TRIMR
MLNMQDETPYTKNITSQRRQCNGCGGRILGSEFLSDLERYYHEDCLVCHNCRKALTDGFYDVSGANFCAKCFQETYLPRCSKCDFPITGSTATMIHGMLYHPYCVRCQKCKDKACLEEVIVYDKHFYCVECFESNNHVRNTRQPLEKPTDASDQDDAA